MNTNATTKQSEGHGKQENFSVKSSPVQVEAAPKHYPDVLDIAGMDYSPARRKSPIHNWSKFSHISYTTSGWSWKSLENYTPIS